MSAEVVTRDKSTGRLHRQTLRDDGKLASYEGCNLDDAGESEILTEEEAAYAIQQAEAGQLCENDFPDVGDVGDAE